MVQNKNLCVQVHVHVLPCPMFPLTLVIMRQTFSFTLQTISFFRLLQLATKMAVHGTLALFDPDEEDWVEHTDKLSYYFTANGITDGAKKRAKLLCPSNLLPYEKFCVSGTVK